MFAEFSIIFVGVTLGLLADDWRQQREADSAARAVLRELSADLETDSLELSSILGRMEGLDRGATWVLARLGDSEADTEEAVPHLRTLFFFALYEPVNAAYVSLKDGGQMSLIRDAQLRRDIVRWYEMRQPYIARNHALVMGARQRWLEAAIPHFQLMVPDSLESLRSIPPQEIVTSWAEISRDEGIRVALEQLGVYSAVLAEALPPMLSEASQLRTALTRASRHP